MQCLQKLLIRWYLHWRVILSTVLPYLRKTLLHQSQWDFPAEYILHMIYPLEKASGASGRSMSIYTGSYKKLHVSMYPFYLSRMSITPILQRDHVQYVIRPLHKPDSFIQFFPASLLKSFIPKAFLLIYRNNHIWKRFAGSTNPDRFIVVQHSIYFDMLLHHCQEIRLYATKL